MHLPEIGIFIAFQSVFTMFFFFKSLFQFEGPPGFWCLKKCKCQQTGSTFRSLNEIAGIFYKIKHLIVWSPGGAVVNQSLLKRGVVSSSPCQVNRL